MRIRSSLLAMVLGLAALSGAAAEAQRPDRGPLGQNWNSDAARDAVRQGRHLPFRDLLRVVENQIPGEPRGLPQLQERGDGRGVYLLRWLTPDGRLLNLIVDAETGVVQR